MNREDIICHCKRVTYGQLVDAVEMGVTSYPEGFALLKYGVGCGRCKAKIKQYIYLLNVEKNNNNNEKI